MKAEELFARHLDLTALRGRRHGLVPCVFHRDDTASLSVDLDRGVFHCFGCGAAGGLKRFSELTGERRPETSRRSEPETMQARMARLALREPWAHESCRLMYEASDWLRQSERWITWFRAAATVAGPDAEDVWEGLSAAARRESLVWAVEAEYGDLLATGHMPVP